MQSFFVRNAKAQFVAATGEMLDIIVTTFQDCDDTKETHLYFNNVTKHSDAKIEEAIESWCEHLYTKLNTKKIKYAKAVERITGRATVYHALTYRDIEALKVSVESGVAARIGLFSKWGDARLDNETKDTLWNLLDMITKASLSFKEQEPPTVPTRQQIQDNIQQTRTNSDDGAAAKDASMLVAFRTDMETLCTAWGAKVSSLSDDSVCMGVLQQWSRLNQSEENGVDFRTLCMRKTSAVVSGMIRASVPELNPPEDIDDDAWGILGRLNNVSTVVGNIPSGMMTHIEAMAAKLATGLQSGQIDMANVDLASLGEQVLSKCSEKDMSNFAGNLENLLPVVHSTMQQSTPRD